MIAVLLFASGIIANLLSNDLEARLGKLDGYTLWLYVAGGVSLLLAIVLAIGGQQAAHDAGQATDGDYTKVGDLSDSQVVAVGAGARADVHIHNYAPIAQPANAQEQRDRRTMIARQRSISINGVLKQSLWNDVLIALGLAERPNTVHRPYRIASRSQGEDDRLLPAGTLVTDIYDQHQGALLILGVPGSGKTTLMLERMLYIYCRWKAKMASRCVSLSTSRSTCSFRVMTCSTTVRGATCRVQSSRRIVGRSTASIPFI